MKRLLSALRIWPLVLMLVLVGRFEIDTKIITPTISIKSSYFPLITIKSNKLTIFPRESHRTPTRLRWGASGEASGAFLFCDSHVRRKKPGELHQESLGWCLENALKSMNMIKNHQNSWRIVQLGQLKHLKEHQSRFHYKLVCLNMHGPVLGTSTWHFFWRRWWQQRNSGWTSSRDRGSARWHACRFVIGCTYPESTSWSNGHGVYLASCRQVYPRLESAWGLRCHDSMPYL